MSLKVFTTYNSEDLEQTECPNSRSKDATVDQGKKPAALPHMPVNLQQKRTEVPELVDTEEVWIKSSYGRSKIKGFCNGRSVRRRGTKVFHLGVAYAGLCMHEYLAYAWAFRHIYGYMAFLPAQPHHQLSYFLTAHSLN